jgi:hypothetical protein
MSITAISSIHAVAARASEPRPSAVVAALPDMPKPVTPATAAGYLMQVPSARVLEALASLQRAMGQQAQSSDPLADAARRLAKAVAPAAPDAAVHVEA